MKRMGELRDKWRNSALAAGEASRIIQKRQMLFSEKKGALRTADGLPDVAPIEWYIRWCGGVHFGANWVSTKSGLPEDHLLGLMK